MKQTKVTLAQIAAFNAQIDEEACVELFGQYGQRLWQMTVKNNNNFPFYKLDMIGRERLAKHISTIKA
jgi:hypothetical protein